MLIEEYFKNLQIAYLNGTVTRGEFGALLARALKLNSIDLEFSFTDRGQTPACAKPYVATAAEAVTLIFSCAKQSITNVLARLAVPV
ncbi:hypothetical protein [Sporosarcina sp. NPDC096371]|uniref:hypothetical protein n=1 Tax=Sporosarcina sp. NPDC096371 TaxID=3364530 RepID=UPI003815B2A3